MSQNCINDFVERINNNYLIGEFNKTRIPKKHKSLGKRVRQRKLSKKDYNIIVSKFYEIYYNELYFLNRPSYFFLGGFLEVKRTEPGVRSRRGPDGKMQRIHVEFPMSISWTDIFFMKQKERQITYLKTKGKTGKTNKIEKEWLESNDYYKLRKV